MTIKSKIAAFLQSSPKPLTNAAIAKALNLNPDSTRRTLRQMRDANEVECTGITYTLIKTEPTENPRQTKVPKSQYNPPWALGRKTRHLEQINWIK